MKRTTTKLLTARLAGRLHGKKKKRQGREKTKRMSSRTSSLGWRQKILLATMTMIIDNRALLVMLMGLLPFLSTLSLSSSVQVPPVYIHDYPVCLPEIHLL